MCKRILKSETNNKGGIPFYKIGSFGKKTDVFIDKDKFELYKSKYPYPKKGDVLISAAGSIGKTVIFDGKDSYFQDSNIVWIDNDETKVLNPYLQYCYKNAKWKTTVGNTIVRLYNEGIRNTEIRVPSIPEQRKITFVLDKIQSAIDNKKQQLSLLDEAVQSEFVEMFGDNPVESGKWQVENLGSMCSISGGYAFKSGDFKENGIPILRIGNINAGFFRPVNMVYWNENTNLEKYAVYPGDLVMSLTGTAGKEDYGNICILDNEYPKYYLNQRNAMFTKLKDLNKFYLAFLLKLPNMKSRLTGLNHGVRQGNILNKDLETLPLPIPPLDLQNKFAAFVQQIDKSKFVVKKQIADLQELFDSKMQEYFGE